MNPSSPTHDPAAEDHAALWAARLEGSVLGAADRAALDAWLAASPSHRPLLSRYCQFSADLEQQLPALVAAGAVDLPVEKSPARGRWKVIRVAGFALATAAAVALVVWVARPGGRMENIATPAGQRQSLTLADGTRVELNARTSLQIENGRTERRVRLASGEAFFHVAKDQARPFIVETPAGSVRVTGTKFDVRSETTAELDVTVLEGSVQVRPGEKGAARASDPLALVGGDRLSVGAKGVTRSKLSSDDLADALAWRDGQIVFDNTPLTEAVECYAHHHGRGISVSPAAAAAGLHVGGRKDLDDLDKFLAELAKTQPVRVTPGLSGTIRVSLLSEP